MTLIICIKKFRMHVHASIFSFDNIICSPRLKNVTSILYFYRNFFLFKLLRRLFECFRFVT